jgi:hypothetical protein
MKSKQFADGFGLEIERQDDIVRVIGYRKIS